jgi:hypothetical protein
MATFPSGTFYQEIATGAHSSGGTSSVRVPLPEKVKLKGGKDEWTIK